MQKDGEGNPPCMCDSQNMKAFVCKNNETFVPTPEATALAAERRAAVKAEGEASNFHVTAKAALQQAHSPREKTIDVAASAEGDDDVAATGGEPPNVVMLFIDDSGYGDTQVYGAPSTETPAMNKMAREGARFTQWYSAHAICTPSRAALM